MRFLDNVCHLGGFHPSSDGTDSELCYFNEGELINDKSYDDSVKLKRTEMDPFRLG